MASAAALQTWEAANNITELSDDDLIFKYDAAKHNALCEAAPWTSDPHYFRHVKISALALLKMVMHARSGGRKEVMGLMQGKVTEHTMIVMDVFALPVEGTETQVSAQDSAYAYMFSYQELIKKVGRLENVMGWYHSHPGYGCWLSGIDVGTQTLHQTGNDPFLAVVVDPVRTISAGKVELGAFRCYPAGYHPPNEPVSEYQTIPLEKIEDFGVHSKQYYPLEVSYFKSVLDRQLLTLLWNTYWVNTLSSSPLLANAGYITGQVTDLAEKLDQTDAFHLAHSRTTGTGGDARKDKLAKCAKDGARLVIEDLHGLMAQTLKDEVFNKGPTVPFS